MRHPEYGTVPLSVKGGPERRRAAWVQGDQLIRSSDRTSGN